MKQVRIGIVSIDEDVPFVNQSVFNAKRYEIVTDPVSMTYIFVHHCAFTSNKTFLYVNSINSVWHSRNIALVNVLQCQFILLLFFILVSLHTKKRKVYREIYHYRLVFAQY